MRSSACVSLPALVAGGSAGRTCEINLNCHLVWICMHAYEMDNSNQSLMTESLRRLSVTT
jgi:hypothetical protein